MTHSADLSGSFQRPHLVDYLLVAEQLGLDIALNVHVGRLEIGVVGIDGGQVIYAEMPGASGSTALSLLMRLPSARIVPGRWERKDSNLDKPWRELVDGRDGALGTDRTQRLGQVRAELRDLDDDSAGESGRRLVLLTASNSGAFTRVDPGGSEDSDGSETAAAADILDVAMLDAYLRGGIEHARELLLARDRLEPGLLLVAANLERIRLRLLDDEFVTSIAEVGS